MARQASILTVTLNPALDLASSTPRIEPNHKLRCSNPTAEPGGGGVNVSRAISLLGGNSDLLVALGGLVGQQIESLLRDSHLEPIVMPVSINSRLALAISDDTDGVQYRFGFPGENLTDTDIDSIRQRIQRQLEQGYDIVALSGSLAGGMPDDFYARLIDDTRTSGARAVLDAHGASLMRGIEATPWLIKLDYHEALELFALTALDADTALKAAQALRDRQAAETVIITMREKGAVVCSAAGNWRITPPAVTVNSAIGAGDSFIAALCLATARGDALVEACRFGVATAAAAVATPGSHLCERETAERYREMTTVEELGRS